MQGQWDAEVHGGRRLLKLRSRPNEALHPRILLYMHVAEPAGFGTAIINIQGGWRPLAHDQQCT